MIIGAAYYPEHWDKERWKQDAHLMCEMGINTIRIGEFAWSVMEKEEGKYDFSLFDEAISLFAGFGVRIIMGTPTAAPPAWLCRKYKNDFFMKDRAGKERGFGSRRHYCYNHDGYRQECKKIVTAMLEHFKDNENIIAWQVDNELGCEDEVRCYCENCRKSFINWLQEKYQDLEKLNEAWGTVFWSQIYTDWAQITLPKETVVDPYTGNGHNPGLLLDFARFSSDSLISFVKEQCDLIRQHSDKPIAHNMVSEYCDNYKLAPLFDAAGYDAYPRSEWDDNSPGRIGFHYDLTRGYMEKPFWILEQQSGPCGWNVLGKTPEEGELALWSLQGTVRGADALVYFRWRTCLFGAEQFWYGILDHDGVPRKRFRELKQAVASIQKYQHIYRLPNDKEVLLAYDYDNKFSLEFQPHSRSFCYKEEVIRYYEALMRLHVPVDVGQLSSDLTKYKAMLLPYMTIAGERQKEILETYVENGGILILTPFCGQRDACNRMVSETLPGVFRDLAGITVEAFYNLEKHCEPSTKYGNIHIWKEEIRTVSASFIDACGESRGFVSVNSYGKGCVYYISAVFREYDCLLTDIFAREQIKMPDLPAEVEAVSKAEGRYLILLNHSSEEKSVCVSGYRELQSGCEKVKLSKYGNIILEKAD